MGDRVSRWLSIWWPWALSANNVRRARSCPARFRHFGGNPAAEGWENRTFGVLQLTIKANGYDWRFVPIDGQSSTDAGSSACVM